MLSDAVAGFFLPTDQLTMEKRFNANREKNRNSKNNCAKLQIQVTNVGIFSLELPNYKLQSCLDVMLCLTSISLSFKSNYYKATTLPSERPQFNFVGTFSDVFVAMKTGYFS